MNSDIFPRPSAGGGAGDRAFSPAIAEFARTQPGSRQISRGDHIIVLAPVSIAA
jgi:hypothetical protein